MHISSAVKTAVSLALGTTALLASQVSHAAVVYSGTVNLAIPNTLNGLYLNVLTGANNLPGSTAGSTVPGWDINPYGTTSLSLFSATPTASSGYVSTTGVTPATNLTLGTSISAASTFITAVNTPAPAGWNLNSSNNYVGFRFLNETGSTVHYGWFQLAIGADTLTRTLVSYAYESTPGAAILAGVVPEPGTYGLMGLGIAGVLLAARRRKQA
jgi:hypothetical protein